MPPGSFDDPTSALLLIAHGSRKAAANGGIAALAERIARLGTDEFERVEAVFLELAEAGIEQGVASLVSTSGSRPASRAPTRWPRSPCLAPGRFRCAGRTAGSAAAAAR
ncbi:MAG: CbiX/SirB N-terminal domain-containing protein [Gammaproteobacteria bacterium]|nr:CbiX/SirB N-terminal domain-containing protein [Gammaproteobacteria bacterium]